MSRVALKPIKQNGAYVGIQTNSHDNLHLPVIVLVKPSSLIFLYLEDTSNKSTLSAVDKCLIF